MIRNQDLTTLFVLIVLFLVKTLFSPHYIIITNEKRTGSGLALRRDVWSRDVSSTPVLSGSDVWRDDWSFPMTVYNRGYGSSRRYGRGGYGMGGYGGYGGVSSFLVVVAIALKEWTQISDF